LVGILPRLAASTESHFHTASKLTSCAVQSTTLTILSHDELPFLIVHLTLLTPEGEDASMLISPEPPDTGEIIAMLYGTLIAAPTEMLDQAGGRGIYFCFPDVSCRYEGRWRLMASLLRVTG
jgi:hypothetical protein